MWEEEGMENKWRGWNIWTPKLSAAALFMIWSDLVILQQLCCNQLKVHLLKYKTVKSFNHASSQATFFLTLFHWKGIWQVEPYLKQFFHPPFLSCPSRTATACYCSWPVITRGLITSVIVILISDNDSISTSPISSIDSLGCTMTLCFLQLER